MRMRLGLMIFCVGLWACGCADRREALRARFAKSQNCPESSVFVTKEGDVYKISGCGVKREYVCPFSPQDVKYCNETGLPPRDPTGAPRKFPERPEDHAPSDQGRD